MYPELYVAVGAHSGLPYGAAHDMPSAFAAMQGGSPLPGRFKQRAAASATHAPASHRAPTIVFHGDHDRTVDARNGAAIVEEATVAGARQSRLRETLHRGTASGGRAYTFAAYLDDADQPVVEHWRVHGAGHAWSGGSPDGSFTDATGPDASAEMIRFFHSQRRAGTS
jgi:poly(3-hydroxybutyrate) depolymerase